MDSIDVYRVTPVSGVLVVPVVLEVSGALAVSVVLLASEVSLVSSITGRLRQKQEMIRDESLKQVVSDVGALICSHIRSDNKSSYRRPDEPTQP